MSTEKLISDIHDSSNNFPFLAPSAESPAGSFKGSAIQPMTMPLSCFLLDALFQLRKISSFGALTAFVFSCCARTLSDLDAISWLQKHLNLTSEADAIKTFKQLKSQGLIKHVDTASSGQGSLFRLVRISVLVFDLHIVKHTCFLCSRGLK
jgi:hypothetical protein